MRNELLINHVLRIYTGCHDTISASDYVRIASNPVHSTIGDNFEVVLRSHSQFGLGKIELITRNALRADLLLLQ